MVSEAFFEPVREGANNFLHKPSIFYTCQEKGLNDGRIISGKNCRQRARKKTDYMAGVFFERLYMVIVQEKGVKYF